MSLLIVFIPFHSFGNENPIPFSGNEIIGKSIKCELQKSTTDINPFSIEKILRPYYFYFENLKTLVYYYPQRIQGEVKILSTRLNFDEKKSQINIWNENKKYLGFISKDYFIFITSKYKINKRKYFCSYLSSPKEIIEDFEKFIKKIDL